MPLLEVTCGKHQYEVFSHTSELKETKCRYCKRKVHKDEIASMQRGITPRYELTMATGAKRHVIHKDAKGNVRFPMHENAPIPKGFMKVEMDTAEVRKFEREMNVKERAKYSEYKSREREHFNKMQAVRRRDLRSAIENGSISVRGPDGKMQRVEFSEFDKDFARFAMEQNNQRAYMDSHFDPGFCVEALSFDSSNREQYSDVLTGWKGRK